MVLGLPSTFSTPRLHSSISQGSQLTFTGKLNSETTNVIQRYIFLGGWSFASQPVSGEHQESFSRGYISQEKKNCVVMDINQIS